MLGIGEVGPEATRETLDPLTEKEGRHPHLLDDKVMRTSRSDVRSRRPGGRSNDLDTLIDDIETATDSPRLVDAEDLSLVRPRVGMLRHTRRK